MDIRSLTAFTLINMQLFTRLKKDKRKIALALLLSLMISGMLASLNPAYCINTKKQRTNKAASFAVKKGSVVEIEYKKGALRMRTHGTILKNGNPGDEVKARIKTTGKIVTVRLTSAQSACIK